VVVKPNLVREFRESAPDDGDCLVTHGAVIRAVVDYAYIALEGRGRIIVADAPQDDADFDSLLRITGLGTIQEFYRRHVGFPLEVYDLRRTRDRRIDGLIVGREVLAGDPAGYTVVDLAHHSAFAEIEHLCHLLYGSDYDTSEVREHQRPGVHEYLVSRTVLEADCVIEVPKLKTHKKVGLTANMKLLVGICGDKNWVAHYRVGVPDAGGDAFDTSGIGRRTERVAVDLFKSVFPRLGRMRDFLARPVRRIGELAFGSTDRVVRSGNWHGNDTAWRMAHDLMRLVLYADARGFIGPGRARNIFSVVDGIVGGEGDGPLDPRPKPAGIVLAGNDPVAVDLACARVMGFDYQRIPMLQRTFDRHLLPLASFEYADVQCHSTDARFNGSLTALHGRLLAFEPHFGWKGYVEESGTSG
jgi:uncharacterized protein (DUF362 family)